MLIDAIIIREEFAGFDTDIFLVVFVGMKKYRKYYDFMDM